MQLQFESMLVPYSKFVGGVLFTGEYVLLIPRDADGNLNPYMEMFGGYRNQVGRSKKYLPKVGTTMPHQGSKERRRRILQADLLFRKRLPTDIEVFAKMINEQEIPGEVLQCLQ